MTRMPPFTAAKAEEGNQRVIRSAQQELIEALADGDHSRSASALAELRLALHAAALPAQHAESVLNAVDSLGNSLRNCYSIHDDRRIAA